MNDFKDLRIVDNFYQTSSFFPMPLTLIGTLDENGNQTSFGAYSLIFPYYIAGKSKEDDPQGVYPKIISEAYQVFECTWVDELDNATNDKVLEEYE